MRVARVFPRRTMATPIDDLAFIGDPPGLFPPEVDKVEISVSFTWDLPEAERLKKEWSSIAPTDIGGPATGMRGQDFELGRFLKPGYVITSRGCRNRCWFCSVWKREGDIRELPITEGWNVLDDNLLATSEYHFNAVCHMLSKQKNPIEFTGGLEAAILDSYQAELLFRLKSKTLFFAYDTHNDREPLFEAGKLLQSVGFTVASHVLRCYVLIGYSKDTFEAAESRLFDTIKAGFMPMAMLYRDDTGLYDQAWKTFQRQWANPFIVATKIKQAALDK